MMMMTITNNRYNVHG